MPYHTTHKIYFIFYTKHDPGDDDHPIARTTYAPPKPGGSFIINGNAIDNWPVIGKFAYLKMIATLTLKRLNEKRKMLNLPPVAEGPILQEFENIEYCRLIFNITGSYRTFIEAFISVNSMSLVAWPVGQHNDHFSKDGESLENKITFVVHSVK